MRKSELSAAQLRDLNIFNLILECNGWEDPYDTEPRFDAGEMVNPEGFRCYRNRDVSLQARFHAPVSMISVLMTDFANTDRVQFHFLFEGRPERILEWLAASAPALDLESYPDLLRKAENRCEMILLEVSDTEIYEVKPSADVR
ncbi:MAG: hypothetical protein NW241_05565 [Bacteroidia bacterium]|nr:hypothetical protein [Bacteroidia bacterium]